VTPGLERLEELVTLQVAVLGVSCSLQLLEAYVLVLTLTLAIGSLGLILLCIANTTGNGGN
jgi:hypothetical protein